MNYLLFLPFIVYIVSFWKIFIKAGKPGWHSIVPFYSVWKLLQMAGKPAWWSLFFDLLLIYVVAASISPPLIMLFISPIFTNIFRILILILLIIFSISISSLGKKFGKTRLFSVYLLVVVPVYIPVILLIILNIYTYKYNSTGTESVNLAVITRYLSMVTSILLIPFGLVMLAFGKSIYNNQNVHKGNNPTPTFTQVIAQNQSQPIQQVISNSTPRLSQPTVTNLQTQTYVQPIPVQPAEQVEASNSYQSPPQAAQVYGQPEMQQMQENQLAQPPVEPPQPPTFV